MILNFLKNKKLAEKERVDTIRQINRMLDKLKEYHISHGDLKYSNILIGDTGPTIIDLDAMKVHRWRWLFNIKRNKDLTRLSKKIPNYFGTDQD